MYFLEQPESATMADKEERVWCWQVSEYITSLYVISTFAKQSVSNCVHFDGRNIVK